MSEKTTDFDHLERTGETIDIWLMDQENERLCRFPMPIFQARRLRDALAKTLHEHHCELTDGHCEHYERGGHCCHCPAVATAEKESE